MSLLKRLTATLNPCRNKEVAQRGGTKRQYGEEYAEDYIADVVASVHTIAMVGASPGATKFSYGVLRLLHEQGLT